MYLGKKKTLKTLSNSASYFNEVSFYVPILMAPAPDRSASVTSGQTSSTLANNAASLYDEIHESSKGKKFITYLIVIITFFNQKAESISEQISHPNQPLDISFSVDSKPLISPSHESSEQYKINEQLDIHSAEMKKLVSKSKPISASDLTQALFQTSKSLNKSRKRSFQSVKSPPPIPLPEFVHSETTPISSSSTIDTVSDALDGSVAGLYGKTGNPTTLPNSVTESMMSTSVSCFSPEPISTTSPIIPKRVRSNSINSFNCSSVDKKLLCALESDDIPENLLLSPIYNNDSTTSLFDSFQYSPLFGSGCTRPNEIIFTTRENELFELFFTYQNSLPLSFINRTSFFANIQYQPAILLLSMCAFGEIVGNDAKVPGVENISSKNLLSEKSPYFKKAKSLSTESVENPSLSVLQALIVLAFCSRAMNHTALYGLYSSVALRMALFLQLDFDPDISMDPSVRNLPWVEKETRRRCWWICYVLDRGTQS